GARTARVTIGEGDRTVLECNDAAVGDGDFADRGGEGGGGRVAMVMGLTVDVPGGGPHLWGHVLQQANLAPCFFAYRAGEQGEGLGRAKEGGAGRQPRSAVR